jgi:hypothetical protein
MLSDHLDVANVVIHVDARPMHSLLARMRGAATGCSLVEEHSPVLGHIEEATSLWGEARSWTPVKIDRWRTVWGTDLLVVEDMAVPDIESTCRKRF